MSSQKVYLKQNVQLDPLFNQWYVWPHLIAPTTAAMNIANSHVKIVKSYVMAPEIHAAAIKNPAMRGGPFLDFDSKRVYEIKALLDKTTKTQAHLLQFAESIKSLNNILLNEAKGNSLETLYSKVPDLLKGYVELVYDINNHPSMRFIERLLYKSQYYNLDAQSIALSLVEGDERPFVFSTPRMQDDKHVHLHIPLKSPEIDELFRMRKTPQTYDYIKEVLNVQGEQEAIFQKFFTSEETAKRQPYNDDTVRIRYLGHACILVERNGFSILTDPLVGYHYEGGMSRYTYADLPEHIDYVLLTHQHSDHVVFETLLQLRHKIGTVVVPKNRSGGLEDPSLELILRNTGFNNVVEIDSLEAISVPGGEIVGLPFWGEHGDLNISSKTAYLICLGGKSIICAADSSNLEPKLYEHLHHVIGDVDVIFLGMECDGAPMSWMYGALLVKPLDRKMDNSRRLCGSDCQRGLDIIERFNCQQVFVYAMGQEPWLSFITSIRYTDESKPIVESNKLVEACRSKGIESERLFGIKEIFLT
ncbi:MAG: MBL fold metallo-hydrolase [Acidobacteriota bacterium]